MSLLLTTSQAMDPSQDLPSNESATWAADLKQLTPKQLSGCLNGLIHSGGLNHGIEISTGPFAGRLVMARRFDCGAVGGDHNLAT